MYVYKSMEINYGGRERERGTLHVFEYEERVRRNADLIVLKVPTFDLLIFPSREEVGLSGADSEGPHTADVTSQSQLQTTRGQLPQLTQSNIHA